MRRRGSVRIVLAMMTALPAAIAAAQPAPQVTVAQGTLRGAATADGRAWLFYGVPYAAPPLGPLRWRPPTPASGWTGTREAGTPAPACPQNDYGWNGPHRERMSEDCLTLDIRMPADRPAGAALPVFVWVHGGSNRAGSSRGVIESRLTERGVILVAVQYRLGALGFLAHSALSREQGGTSGNYGLMDLVQALRWIRENINRFGGDPDNVTLAGQSAGAQDVSLLMASPLANGLFRRAILHSGTPGFGMAYRPLRDAEALGRQAERQLGSGGLAALRAAPVDQLLEVDRMLASPALINQDFLWLQTTLDGRVLPDRPDRLMARAQRRAVILGTNAVEFGPEGDGPEPAGFAGFWFGRQADRALATYRAEEADRAENVALDRLGGIWLRMQTDAQFGCPASRLAAFLARRRWPVWRYVFDVGQAGGRTAHSAELPYLFNPDGAGAEAPLADLWTAFARGEPLDRPSAVSPAGWPSYRSGRRWIMQFARPAARIALPERDNLCRWSRTW